MSRQHDFEELMGIPMPNLENASRVTQILDAQYIRRKNELNCADDEITSRFLHKAYEYYKDMCKMYMSMLNKNENTMEMFHQIFDKYREEEEKGYVDEDFNEEAEKQYKSNLNKPQEVEGIDEYESPFSYGVGMEDLKDAFLGEVCPSICQQQQPPPSLQEYTRQRERDNELIQRMCEQRKQM